MGNEIEKLLITVEGKEAELLQGEAEVSYQNNLMEIWLQPGGQACLRASDDCGEGIYVGNIKRSNQSGILRISEGTFAALYVRANETTELCNIYHNGDNVAIPTDGYLKLFRWNKFKPLQKTVLLTK